MPTPKTAATYLLSIGLLSLAGALIYFTYAFSKFAVSLPDLITEIQTTQDKFDPIVKEVSDIKMLIPSIVDEAELIRQEIPPIVKEIGEIRKQLPSIVEEAGRYREQIPAILQQVEEIQKQIPPIVEELKNVRETIPGILAEVEAVRAAIPGYLDQAEGIASDIEGAGQKAGEGAVQGVFTGIIKAPVSIVSSFGDNVFNSQHLNAADRALMRQAGGELLGEGKGKKGDEIDWKNPDSGVKGTLSIVSIVKRSGQDYMELNVKATKRFKKIVDDTLTLTRKEDGTWEIVDQE